MKIAFVIALAVLVIPTVSQFGSAQQTDPQTQTDLHEYLVGQLDKLKFEELEPAAQIATYLSISRALHNGGRQELATVVQSIGVKLAEQDEENRHDRTVFDHAMEMKQFELAEEIANRPTSKFMKDRLVAAQIRAGQLEEFRKEDYQVTDFHTADRIAKALVDVGEHEKAIDFATGIFLEPNDGNDPKTVLAFVHRQIANNQFKAGQIEEAKAHIDKAMEIAGGLYYIGYCIQVDHRKIHGKLTEGIEAFAKKGAAYGGHMGDELAGNYARALRENGFYEECQQGIEHIVDRIRLDRARMYLAIEQVEKQEFDLANESIKLIDSMNLRFLVKVRMAIQLKKADRANESEALVAELEKAWLAGDVSECDVRFWHLLGATNDFARSKRHLEGLESEPEKSKMILAVLRGLAGTPIY